MDAVEHLIKGLPGVSGYVDKELRRDADKRLRMMIAETLEAQKQRLFDIQKRLLSGGGLRWLDDGSDVELSYGLLPVHRGKGYATQASAAVIEHGFRVLGLPRIVAVSRRDNLVSHRVLYKCGMQRVTALDTPETRVTHFVLHRHGTAAC